jgi:hypothetical protein
MSSDEEFLVMLLRALATHQLEAIIVGSMAGALQGAPVMTQDIDLLIRDTPLAREKLEKVAASIGAGRPIALFPLSKVLALLGSRVSVDVLFDEISGRLTFVSLRARSVAIAVGSETAVVACLADVIVSKTAAGRAKDLAQLPILNATLQLKQKLK